MLWLLVGSLQSATMGIFTLEKLANAANYTPLCWSQLLNIYQHVISGHLNFEVQLKHSMYKMKLVYWIGHVSQHWGFLLCPSGQHHYSVQCLGVEGLWILSLVLCFSLIPLVISSCLIILYAVYMWACSNLYLQLRPLCRPLHPTVFWTCLLVSIKHLLLHMCWAAVPIISTHLLQPLSSLPQFL